MDEQRLEPCQWLLGNIVMACREKTISYAVAVELLDVLIRRVGVDLPEMWKAILWDAAEQSDLAKPATKVL